MGQPLVVVAIQVIRPKMRASTLFSRQGPERDGFSAIQHEIEFQRPNEARIEHPSLIVNGHARPAFPEAADCPLSQGHPFLLAKHAKTLCHGDPHLVPDTGHGLAGIGPVNEVSDAALRIRHHAVLNTGQGTGFRVFSGTTTRPTPEYHGLQE